MTQFGGNVVDVL